MKLHALKALLRQHPDRLVRIDLPDGSSIPAAYHLTEVGQVSKVFIDCGGKVHSELRCVLQTWVGADREHRLPARRFADILDLGRAVVATEEIDVEIEHGQLQAAQYPIDGWLLPDPQTLTLTLTHKATDCLAREACGADECCGGEDDCAEADEEIPAPPAGAASAIHPPRAVATCCA